MLHNVLIIALIVIEIAAIVTAVTHLARENKKRTSGESFEDRVKRLTKALQDSTTLIGNIESEINARSALATQLQQDLDRYNQLIEIKKPEVEAITQLLRGEIKKEGHSAFWKALLMNFVFFVLGAGASLLIATLIR